VLIREGCHRWHERDTAHNVGDNGVLATNKDLRLEVLMEHFRLAYKVRGEGARRLH